MAKHRRRVSAWLAGLIIAIVLSVVVFILFNALGWGDDPVVEGIAALRR